MKTQHRIIFALCVTALLTAGAGVAMPNPASKYCVDQGFNNTIRTNPDGSQTGYCIFPGGRECEEWAYFRGECKLGTANLTKNLPDVNESNENETNATEIALEAGNASVMPVNTTVEPATVLGTTIKPAASNPKPSPGFGILVSIAVVLSVMYIRGKRK